MLMQSANGEVHLIPALPDVWQANGSISGLRAIGGFEIESLQWKNGKVVKAVVKSKLGGNLRLRVPNALALTGGSLKKATDNNPNPFYYVEETPAALVSTQAIITPVNLKETLLYDVPTQAGKTYTLTAQ